MKLGFKTGYHVPKCLSCLKYMHNPVEGGSDRWTFYHCGHYWVVEYDTDKYVQRVSDSVTGKSCYRCEGRGGYDYLGLDGIESVKCNITLPPLPELVRHNMAAPPAGKEES